MPTKRIKITGVDYPAPASETQKRKTFFPVAPIRPRHMMWLASVGIVAGWIAIYGTVHLRFKYVYSDHGPAFGDSQYYFHQCDYVGWASQTIIPTDGKCPLFKWLKAPRGDGS